MVSVFKLMGRGRPWSFKNKPQALHKTWPVSSRLQSGVVCVLQFLHTGLAILVLVVVVPLLMWVVVLALGCTGLLAVLVEEVALKLLTLAGVWAWSS